MNITIPSLLRIKPGALAKLGKYLRNSGYLKIGLFTSDGIRGVVEPALSVSLDSSEIKIVYAETVTDNRIEDVFESAFAVPQGVDALVAVGGGKAIDFCKYIAFISHLPLVAVPTSLSNDGFCSPVSSLYVKGRRSSLHTKIPEGVVVDTALAAGAPPRFLYSGMGDLISNITAVRDWKLAFYEQGEKVNDFAVLTALQAADNLLNLPVKEVTSEAFVRTLAGGLVMSGVAMEVSGSSRPSSGSDHLLSHAYDLLAKKPSLHGIQVGVATCGVAVLQQNRAEEFRDFVEKTGFAEHVRQNPLERDAFLKAIENAPAVKQNFWSVLSLAENRAALEKLVLWDGWYKQFFA